MHRCKPLAALILWLSLTVYLLAGCGSNAPTGFTLSACVGTRVTTLDPIYAEDIESQSVLVHLYENLMRVASDGAGGTTVVNGMAKDVESEENLDGTVTYTFTLRSARWSDGEKVRARDFVYAWQRLADPASHSPYAALLSVVVGYDEARAEGDMRLLQVSAKNDSTLVVTLGGYYDWFLKEVCTSPATMPLRQDVVQALKEAGIQAAEETGTTVAWWADPTALVTNGPYLATSYEPETFLELSASERYHSDYSGPDAISFRFVSSADEAQTLFQEEAVDIIWPLAETRLAELAADEAWTPVPQLSTYTVVYNCGNELLADPLIRQALTLSIDRAAITELAGITALPAEGLVPPGVPENAEGDYRTMGIPLLDNDPGRYSEYCQLARKILSDAGYDNGAALGQLEYLYLKEGSNGELAQALCHQWQEILGIRVTPQGVTLRELWAALRTGEYALAGVNLEAPANDAECFLMDWTSGNYDNVANYENSAYDTLMAIVARAADGTARMGCLHDAEALLLGDCAICPLYTTGTAWDTRENLTGTIRDARGWFCFSNVIERPAN